MLLSLSLEKYDLHLYSIQCCKDIYVELAALFTLHVTRRFANALHTAQSNTRFLSATILSFDFINDLL